MKKALITGISGQDGSYLAELLLSKGYKVVGVVRRSSMPNLDRIENILTNDNFSLVEGDLADSLSVYSLVQEGNYDEIYNLAAQSHVGTSFKQPHYTFSVDALGPVYFLEAIHKFSPNTRFYQASTSELFGKNFTEEKVPSSCLDNVLGTVVVDDPTSDGICEFKKYQDEDTAFMPQSPYAVAKLAAHHMVRIYREGYGLHASCGILFNHESERRGENFVTRKITKWIGEFVRWSRQVGAVDAGFDTDNVLFDQESFPKLRLGNLDAYRDWGHAKDYVEAMWLMLQREDPEDLVIATGETYSVRDFLNEAFNEIGIDDFEPYVVIDPEFYRPAEVEYLRGNPSKAKKVLGWEPKVSFKDLVTQMVRRDINGKEETPLQPVQQEEIRQQT
jgi:GDPmannose 4,6-dehydratase